MGRAAGQAVTFEDLRWYVDNSVFTQKYAFAETSRILCKKSEVESRLNVQSIDGDAGRAVKSNELIADTPISCGTNVVVRFPDTSDLYFSYSHVDGEYNVYKKIFTIDILGGSGTINVDYSMDNGAGYEKRKQIYVTDGVNYYQSPIQDTESTSVNGSGSFNYDSANGNQVEVTLYAWILSSASPEPPEGLDVSWGDFTVSCPTGITQYNILLYLQGSEIMFTITDQDGEAVTLPTPVIVDVTVFTNVGDELISNPVPTGVDSGVFWQEPGLETIDSIFIESWSPTTIGSSSVNVHQ